MFSKKQIMTMVFQPAIYTVPIILQPLQLLAYYVVLIKGWDVDHPRNLAKSITVE
jgi:glutamine---fructose-6-phosphate transaminase (isomerizing)